jgi:hypothetical protein
VCDAIRSNIVYNFCGFPGGVKAGASTSPVSNVTFHGCWFHGTAVGDGLVVLFADNVTFDYS